MRPRNVRTCHGLSQSSGIAKVPNQVPAMAPMAGKNVGYSSTAMGEPRKPSRTQPSQPCPSSVTEYGTPIKTPMNVAHSSVRPTNLRKAEWQRKQRD